MNTKVMNHKPARGRCRRHKSEYTRTTNFPEETLEILLLSPHIKLLPRFNPIVIVGLKAATPTINQVCNSENICFKKFPIYIICQRTGNFLYCQKKTRCKAEQSTLCNRIAI